jgi:hypothetical protein
MDQVTRGFLTVARSVLEQLDLEVVLGPTKLVPRDQTA